MFPKEGMGKYDIEVSVKSTTSKTDFNSNLNHVY